MFVTQRHRALNAIMNKIGNRFTLEKLEKINLGRTNWVLIHNYSLHQTMYNVGLYSHYSTFTSFHVINVSGMHVWFIINTSKIYGSLGSVYTATY